MPDTSYLRVLLVEDHFATRAALSIWLTDFGHEVLGVGTISDALKAAPGKIFDVVVSDIELPDGDGRDLIRLLVTTHKFRAIAISGARVGKRERELSRAAGFSAHLEKPFTTADFNAALISD